MYVPCPPVIFYNERYTNFNTALPNSNPKKRNAGRDGDEAGLNDELSSAEQQDGDKDKNGELSEAESELNVQFDDEEAAYFEEEDEQIENMLVKFSIETYYDNSTEIRKQDPASQYFPQRDLSHIALRPDHASRPIWIDPTNGAIILESFSPSFKEAEKFLINIAEPISRVALVHEYTITSHSLTAAVAIGLSFEQIIHKLDYFSKTEILDSTKRFIEASTKSFGQVHLVLKNTRYMIETSDIDVLQRLLRDPVIGPLRVNLDEEITKSVVPAMGALVIPGTKSANEVKQVAQNADGGEGANGENTGQGDNEDAKLAAFLDEDEEVVEEQIHSFEIAPQTVQTVSKRCKDINLPLTEEYDFHNDNVNADLEIDLNPITSIRPYQEAALRKMFGNRRAKSGIIVLPCGAGKTLVGITAACTLRKSVIVLCTSAMSVGQWRSEFLKWSNVNPKDVAVFTSEQKDMFPGNAGIVISTYFMLAQTRARSHASQKVMDFLENREWGLMLLDEVHVAPAEVFKKVTYKIKAHTKLGLTATLLREDNKIQELNFLIGPKLYEANWQELSQQGHIARVQCAEVWCQMAPEFYLEYIRTNQVHQRTLLFTMNPYKFQACQFLIDYHERRGDKILVFADNLFTLKWYALKLNKCYIHGDTTNSERVTILDNFMHNPKVRTIFLSKIGDTSLDLPEATCLIQISSHYGSRRQEAQRLGRILRAKRRNDEGFNAFFYSLVSKGTKEMYYSAKRQAFLVDQGYAFKVITQLDGLDETPDLAFQTPQERRELLAEVMRQNALTSQIETIKGDLFSSASDRKKKAKRSAGLLSDLSGGQDMAYAEFGKKDSKSLTRSSVFTKLRRDHKKRQEMWDSEIQAAEHYSKAAGFRK